jgi:IS116/IS110/IS902 family transposase
MAVQSAKKYNSQIKAYFEKKKEQGKHILLISNNIKFKLVNIAFAVIKRGTPYVDIYKYATVA